MLNDRSSVLLFCRTKLFLLTEILVAPMHALVEGTEALVEPMFALVAPTETLVEVTEALVNVTDVLLCSKLLHFSTFYIIVYV